MLFSFNSDQLWFFNPVTLLFSQKSSVTLHELTGLRMRLVGALCTMNNMMSPKHHVLMLKIQSVRYSVDQN